VSEIFDADPPHAARGCIAQAWSVAELLRAAMEDVYTNAPATRAARAPH
jgi:glycogen debranching enzyme